MGIGKTVKMGGGSIPPIPDYKQYKIDGIKELEWVQSELAKKGLKDPWLRNEVWRYQNWPGHNKGMSATIFRGFKYAAGLMVLTIGADLAFGISKRRAKHMATTTRFIDLCQ